MIAVVDSHCHLDFDEFAADLDGVVARAEAVGVGLIVTIGTRLTTFAKTLSIAERFANVFCSVGVHPHNAASEGARQARELIELASHPKVVAIGEAGLDYHYDFSPRDVQEQSFRMQIDAARQTGLPLIVHSREAEEDTARVLEEEMRKGAFTPLLHCFSSGAELAERGLAIGAYISFSGILTFKTATAIAGVAQKAPADRVLVETDAPYLAPVPHRGKVNEPALVVHTLRKLAELRSTDEKDMAVTTNRNFFRLFAKVPRPAAFDGQAR
jgi:TatD DNase family protein